MTLFNALRTVLKLHVKKRLISKQNNILEILRIWNYNLQSLYEGMQ